MRILSGRFAGVSPATLHAVLALTAVMGLDTSDQSAIGATAPEVRTAFHLGQTQIGLLATSSTVVGVLFTLPFGIVADRSNRLRALRATVAVWIAAALVVGAAPSFGVMVAAHSLLGLVTGAASPLIASLVGDLARPSERGRVYSALLVGELAGSALGLAVSGEVAALAGWRWAFWALAMVAFGVLLLLARVPEPPRLRPAAAPGGSDVAELNLMQAIRVLLRIRTNVLLVVASALGYYFFAGVQTFAVSLLTEDYHVSVTVAPLLVLLVGLSLAVGVIVGGPVADRLLARQPRFGRLPLVLVAFAGSLVFIVPALASSRIFLTMPLLLIGGVLLGAANPALDATRIDIVASRLLGRAEAVRSALRDGGDAIAPLAFGAVGGAFGLRQAFLLMTSSLGLAFVLGLTSMPSYSRDAAAATAAT